MKTAKNQPHRFRSGSFVSKIPLPGQKANQCVTIRAIGAIARL
jgi:hypothetical protein